MTADKAIGYESYARAVEKSLAGLPRLDTHDRSYAKGAIQSHKPFLPVLTRLGL